LPPDAGTSLLVMPERKRRIRYMFVCPFLRAFPPAC
jgi:hypothetical protein